MVRSSATHLQVVSTPLAHTCVHALKDTEAVGKWFVLVGMSSLSNCKAWPWDRNSGVGLQLRNDKLSNPGIVLENDVFA